MKVMMLRMITVTQKIETKLVIKLRVTIIRMVKENTIEMMMPWKAPVTKAFSDGISTQAALVWNMFFISFGARSFCLSI